MNTCSPRSIPLLSAIVALLLAAAAQAATFCANNGSELNSAINAAEANGGDDEIRLSSGTFASSTAFNFQSTEPYSIKFVGGWISSCFANVGLESKVDGQQQRRGLNIMNPNGDIEVIGIFFTRGLSTSNRGGGLRAESESGDIRIDRNTFIANRADDMAGAAKIVTQSGSLRVRGNLAFANSAANIGAFELFQGSGTAYVVGNTITVNESEGPVLPGGLGISGSAHFKVSNNIIWNNLPDDPGPDQCDFFSSASYDLNSNNIGVISSTGTAPTNSVNAFSVDPQFADCGFLCISFELERSSPLVDAGDNFPPGEITGLDLAGKPRLIGGIVDIGAFENDEIFDDSFE